MSLGAQLLAFAVLNDQGISGTAEWAPHERFRCMRLGRVRANRTTLKRPDNSNSASVEAVTANGTVLPLNAEKRAPEMGSTCHLLSRGQQRNAGQLTTPNGNYNGMRHYHLE